MDFEFHILISDAIASSPCFHAYGHISCVLGQEMLPLPKHSAPSCMSNHGRMWTGPHVFCGAIC